MNQVFLPYLRMFVIVFSNDILVYRSFMAEHMHHLNTLLQRLLETQLFAKMSSQFYQKSIEYLEHIVSVEGMKPYPEKIQAMTNWSIPKNLKQLRGFINLTCYYRRFIQGYATIATHFVRNLY